MLQEERSLYVYKQTASLMDPKTVLYSLFTSRYHWCASVCVCECETSLMQSCLSIIFAALELSDSHALLPYNVQISKKCIYVSC
jgi:hypothetical protein